MSGQQNRQKELEEIDAELKRSLKLCHSMINAYQPKFAANSNDCVAAGACKHHKELDS
jgi:hypothetical protein